MHVVGVAMARILHLIHMNGETDIEPDGRREVRNPIEFALDEFPHLNFRRPCVMRYIYDFFWTILNMQIRTIWNCA